MKLPNRESTDTSHFPATIRRYRNAIMLRLGAREERSARGTAHITFHYRSNIDRLLQRNEYHDD